MVGKSLCGISGIIHFGKPSTMGQCVQNYVIVIILFPKNIAGLLTNLYFIFAYLLDFPQGYFKGYNTPLVYWHLCNIEMNTGFEASITN